MIYTDVRTLGPNGRVTAVVLLTTTHAPVMASKPAQKPTLPTAQRQQAPAPAPAPRGPNRLVNQLGFGPLLDPFFPPHSLGSLLAPCHASATDRRRLVKSLRSVWISLPGYLAWSLFHEPVELLSLFDPRFPSSPHLLISPDLNSSFTGSSRRTRAASNSL